MTVSKTALQYADEMDSSPELLIAKKDAEIIDLKRKLAAMERQTEKAVAMLDEARKILSGKFIKADFYEVIERCVRENESVKDAWANLMLVMKLVNPELDEEFQGLLLKDRNNQMKLG
jgi:hypothetical protein